MSSGDTRRNFERALALHRAGDLGAAEGAYREVLAVEPTHFGAAHMLGAVYLQRRAFDPAERQIRRAVQIDPYAADALNNLGLALRHLERFEDAVEAYDRAIALRPDYPEAFCHRGNALRLLGKGDAALASYDRAVALRPGYADAFYNRGALLETMERWDDAVASYENAVALAPDFPQAHNNLGNALLAVRRCDEALAAFDRALALKPDYAEALTNRGNVLRDLHRPSEAIESHDRAIALKPDLAEAFNNRGSAWHDMRRFENAMADYRGTLALAPRHREARASLGLTQLLLGDWGPGLENYEMRFLKRHNAAKRPLHPASEWAGEDLTGRRILAYGEQGFGDVIQFVRFAPLLQALGAEVTVLANRRLHRILSTVGQGIAFTDKVAPDDVFDFQIALMSIPRVLGIRPGTVQAPASYLLADGRRRDIWRARLGEHGFKVGLAWQGNPAGSIDNGRSVPLREFVPLSQIAHVRLISLQKNFGVEQLDRKPQDMIVETPGFDFDEGADAFVDTAAMMANLDLVVTSDTSIAHLAGALGRPVWIALKHVPDWRWLLDRVDSPWYPSARLFRQDRIGNWPDVVLEMAAALRTLAADAARDGDITTAA